jgi:hypothetical protein
VGARASPASRAETVVVDNLSSHKGGRVKEIVRGEGLRARLVCHPTRRISTPSSRPSRRSRGFMRKAEARTREALVEAMGRASDALTSRDARGFFGHCAVTARWTNYYDKRSR